MVIKDPEVLIGVTNNGQIFIRESENHGWGDMEELASDLNAYLTKRYSVVISVRVPETPVDETVHVLGDINIVED